MENPLLLEEDEEYARELLKDVKEVQEEDSEEQNESPQV